MGEIIKEIGSEEMETSDAARLIATTSLQGNEKLKMHFKRLISILERNAPKDGWKEGAVDFHIGSMFTNDVLFGGSIAAVQIVEGDPTQGYLYGDEARLFAAQKEISNRFALGLKDTEQFILLKSEVGKVVRDLVLAE